MNLDPVFVGTFYVTDFRGIAGAARMVVDSGYHVLPNCPHASETGIDQTPLDDPDKLWRCEACGCIRTFIGGVTVMEAQ